jgi:hypothetical protein
MIAAAAMDAIGAVFFRATAMACDEAASRRDDLKRKRRRGKAPAAFRIE